MWAISKPWCTEDCKNSKLGFPSDSPKCVVTAPTALEASRYWQNLAGELEDGWQDFENEVRELLPFRSRLVPFLFSALSEDRFQRIPVCRALACDFPEDPAVRKLEDPFLLGHNIMVASFSLNQIQRQVSNSKAEASANPWKSQTAFSLRQAENAASPGALRRRAERAHSFTCQHDLRPIA